MVAQGAHAAMMFLAAQMRHCDPIEFNADMAVYAPISPTYLTKEMAMWLEDRFTKIVVGVDSEAQLDEIYRLASDAGLPVHMVEDAGLTEFKGIATKTCLAIGPANAERIDKITGHLRLL